MEKTQFKYFETEEDLINYMVSIGVRKKDLLDKLTHEREHARKARELGYDDIKWGYRVIYDDKTRKVIEWRYLIKVEGVMPEDAIKIAKSPEKVSDLDEKNVETAQIVKALDDIGYPRGYIDKNGMNIPSNI
ncbi:hypothetical protein FJZ19_00495 [Candidatus Pacearchaeota archaeon]|nr:hypothetical protein [Candidatus Pacearchaeota archaeon]